MTGAAATDVRRRKIIGAKEHRLFHESGEQDVLHQQRHAEYLGIGDLPATPDNRSREIQTRELSAECADLPRHSEIVTVLFLLWASNLPTPKIS